MWWIMILYATLAAALVAGGTMFGMWLKNRRK